MGTDVVAAIVVPVCAVVVLAGIVACGIVAWTVGETVVIRVADGTGAPVGDCTVGEGSDAHATRAVHNGSVPIWGLTLRSIVRQDAADESGPGNSRQGIALKDEQRCPAHLHGRRPV